VLRVRDLGCFGSREVSILTGPGGPVLLPTYVAGDGDYIVSILTGPGGPVLHKTVPQTVLDLEFQSSPGPKARCYKSGGAACRASPLRFNPHRARRPGATAYRKVAVRDVWGFQSSPGPKARCYKAKAVGAALAFLFQSSPGPKARCYGPMRSSKRLPRRFNPHRARRPGATTTL